MILFIFLSIIRDRAMKGHSIMNFGFHHISRSSLFHLETYFVILLMVMQLPMTFASTENDTQIEIVFKRIPLMGTFVDFKVVTPKDRIKEAEKAIERATAAMQDFVDVISSWDPQSDTSKINTNAGKQPIKINERLMRVLLRAREISKLSGGALDVTVSPVGKLWSLEKDNPLIPDNKQIQKALKLVKYKDLILDQKKGTAFLRRRGMRIDLGAIAKGAAVDVGIASLRKSGFENALINAGGDLYAMGSKPDGPWKVGIQAPREEHGKVMMKFEVEDRAVATSGDYEEMVVINGKRYHHILDPKTGRPADKCISVTVIAENAETADALATAFFVLGPDRGMYLSERLPEVEVLFVDSAFKISRSSSFPKAEQNEIH